MGRYEPSSLFTKELHGHAWFLSAAFGPIFYLIWEALICYKRRRQETFLTNQEQVFCQAIVTSRQMENQNDNFLPGPVIETALYTLLKGNLYGGDKQCRERWLSKSMSLAFLLSLSAESELTWLSLLFSPASKKYFVSPHSNFKVLLCT